MAGQINEGKEEEPWRHEVARAYGSFTRPDLAIPCRVASPQSPTPLHQARRIVAGQGQEKKMHPAKFPGIDGVSKTNHLSQEPTQDATEEYPQSGRAIQVFCLRKAPMGGKGGQTDDRGTGQAACQQPTDLFRLWPQR